MGHVLPLLLHVSHQLTVLGWPIILCPPCCCSWPMGCRHSSHSGSRAVPRGALPRLWGTSLPTMCSDPLTHTCQNSSGGSSGGSSCCDKVGSSCGQCPPPEMPQHQQGGSQRRGVAGRQGWLGRAMLLQRVHGTEKAVPQGVGGCRSPLPHCLRAALSFPMSGS